MHAVWFTEPELELIEDALLERKHTDMELLVDEEDNPVLQPVRDELRQLDTLCKVVRQILTNYKEA